MGYEFHITRKRFWFDDAGPEISQDEWRAVVESDPELSLDRESQHVTAEGEYIYVRYRDLPGALAFRAGEISAKNPDEALVAKMIEIAIRLGGRVQDDDGKVYPRKSPSLAKRLRKALRPVRVWLSRLFSKPLDPVPSSDIPYLVGQRYRYLYGGECVIASIDPQAMHGFGTLTIRFDDGRELSLGLRGDLSVLLLPK